jgi:hypothetical protein
MQKHVLVLTTSAFILSCGAIAASAQQGQMMQQQPPILHQQQELDRQGAMGPGMMGQRGMMGPGSMGSGMMMRMLFTLMDSDGDGTISLQEFQAAHERIFKGMDANKDGRLTLDEIQAFMQGTRRSVPRQ